MGACRNRERRQLNLFNAFRGIKQQGKTLHSTRTTLMFPVRTLNASRLPTPPAYSAAFRLDVIDRSCDTSFHGERLAPSRALRRRESVALSGETIATAACAGGR